MNSALYSKIKEAAKLIQQSKHTTGFTGAGISVESGIPPFRGEGGLWSKYDSSVLDLSNLYANPKEAWIVIKKLFYDFFGKAKPNIAHEFYAKLENHQLLKAVITQNIDNLHQEAGSKTVHEFHGTAQFIICTSCDFKAHSSKVNLSVLPPLCPKCNSILKPNFIFFGEGIPHEAYSQSVHESQNADLFIITGTTGEVMPACMIPQQAKENGAKIIEINVKPSLLTGNITDIFLEGKGGTISAMLLNELGIS